MVFGLPGNPVAVMVTFLMLVKPALLKVLGRGMEPPLKFRARLGKDLKKKPGRLEFVRGVLSREGETLVVQPTVGQGSHMLSGMAKANALIHFPAHEAALVRNDWVETYYVNW